MYVEQATTCVYDYVVEQGRGRDHKFEGRGLRRVWEIFHNTFMQTETRVLNLQSKFVNLHDTDRMK